MVEKSKLDVLHEVKTSKSVLHSIEDHNFWIGRNKVCPYCRSGSRPVAKVLIVKDIEKYAPGRIIKD